MITYKNLFDVFEDIATKHYQIQKLEKGELSDVDIEKMDATNFPLLFVEPESNTIDVGTLTYTVNVFVMDVLFDDQDVVDIYNNTHLILQDIVAEFKQALSSSSFINSTAIEQRANDKYEYTIQLPITTTPFTQRFGNLVTGWYASFSISVYNTNNLCDAPISTS